MGRAEERRNRARAKKPRGSRIAMAAAVAYDLLRLKIMQQLVVCSRDIWRLRVPIASLRNVGFWLGFVPVVVYTTIYLAPNMASALSGFDRYDALERTMGAVMVFGVTVVILFMFWILWRLFWYPGRTVILFALAMQCSVALWGYLRLAEHDAAPTLTVAASTTYLLLSIVVYTRLYIKPVSWYIRPNER